MSFYDSGFDLNHDGHLDSSEQSYMHDTLYSKNTSGSAPSGYKSKQNLQDSRKQESRPNQPLMILSGLLMFLAIPCVMADSLIGVLGVFVLVGIVQYCAKHVDE